MNSYCLSGSDEERDVALNLEVFFLAGFFFGEAEDGTAGGGGGASGMLDGCSLAGRAEAGASFATTGTAVFLAVIFGSAFCCCSFFFVVFVAFVVEEGAFVVEAFDGAGAFFADFVAAAFGLLADVDAFAAFCSSVRGTEVFARLLLSAMGRFRLSSEVRQQAPDAKQPRSRQPAKWGR